MHTITDRIDGITGIDPDHLGEVIAMPRSVKIELTGRCNYACSFCARSHMLREQKDMNKSMYTRLVHEMRSAGVEELGVFYLGESFMLKWLPEAIKLAKDAGFPYVFLTTNGSISNGPRVKECMEAGLNSLKFSFNYASPEQLQEVTKVKQSFFYKMIDNIKAAYKIRQEGGYDCGLYASYIMYDGAQGELMKEAIKEIEPYLDEVYALPLYSHAALTDAASEEAGWAANAGNPGRYDNMRPPVPCWAVFTEGHITWEGKLSACCFGHEDKFDMADLTKVSFEEGWNSLSYQQLRKAHIAKDLRGTPCETCLAY